VPRATKALDSEECVKFERAVMDFLQKQGQLSIAMRPLWEARILARSMLPERRARSVHLTAMRDCLEMIADWPTRDTELANRFLARRGALTIDDVRSRLPRK
jgi:hypothetical protein